MTVNNYTPLCSGDFSAKLLLIKDFYIFKAYKLSK